MSAPIADPLQTWKQTHTYLKSLRAETTTQTIEMITPPEQRKTFKSVLTACIWYSNRLDRAQEMNKQLGIIRGSQSNDMTVMDLTEFEQVAKKAEKVVLGMVSFLETHQVDDGFSRLVKSAALYPVGQAVEQIFEPILDNAAGDHAFFTLLDEIVDAAGAFGRLGPTYSDLVLEDS